MSMAGHETLDAGVEGVLPLDDIVQIHGTEMRLQIEWVGRRDAWVVKNSFPAAGILFPGWWLWFLLLDSTLMAWCPSSCRLTLEETSNRSMMRFGCSLLPDPLRMSDEHLVQSSRGARSKVA